MHKKSIADLAYDILEENHRPMHYCRITEELLKIKDLKAENPNHDVNASIGADKRFIRYHRGIWGLVKWKYKEANLPYTLTSYCLRNGTIFLTTYLRPYFAWSRDDRDIVIVFIDIDGEEIKALVNYRKRHIYGLRDWYQKRKLDVNDRIFIGLIDDKKRRYFIIAEKNIKSDTKKDISDSIYEILKEKGHPLSFSQIYSAIIKKDPDNNNGLFSDYIENTLNNDIRYLEISDNQWGLIEWVNKAEQLYRILLNSSDTRGFQSSIKQAFEFLGYEVNYADNNQQELLIARAFLDYKSYSILILGLPKNYNINKIHSIDWKTIKAIRESIDINSVIFFSDRFDSRELIDRSNEESIQLYELSILYHIMKEHQKIPFSLFELQLVFSPLHHPKNNLNKLLEIRKDQWQQWILIKNIIKILQKARRKNNYMDISLLEEELNHVIVNDNMANLEEGLIKKLIVRLRQEPFRLIELSESGNIILAFCDSLVQKRVNKLFRFFINERLQ
jgi:DNA-directed RNA polymerase delta subunit